MNAAAVGTILAALIALASAVYTGSANRKAQAKAAAVAQEAADRESQREFQIEFVQTLSSEVEKLNVRIADLRSRLSTAEDLADSERGKRREVEMRLQALVETVERLKTILTSIPEAYSNPTVRRILDAPAA